MKYVIVCFSIFIIFFTFLEGYNARLEFKLARDFYNHHFNEKAKEKCIIIYNHPMSSENLKAAALYLLGQISFEEEDYKVAIDDWEILINEFPDSPESKEIDRRIPEIQIAVNKGPSLQVSSLEIANDFHRHNFSDKAKEKFLEIYHDPDASNDEKAEALYLLGQVTFEDGDYTIALDDWSILIEKFPESEHTKEISKRLTHLKDIISSDSEGSVTNVIARSYIKNGDFWSNSKNKFIVDSSWMPSLDIAVDWYDRVINEFPKSNAAEVAYQRKIFSILGWKESGRDGAAFGLMFDFDKYIPLLLKTFNDFEKDFPNSIFLQGFRYQIAQTFWANEDWENSKKWLEKVIAAGNGEKTFYTETAKARIKKLNH